LKGSLPKYVPPTKTEGGSRGRIASEKKWLLW
jgi:hypothetical protein